MRPQVSLSCLALVAAAVAGNVSPHDRLRRQVTAPVPPLEWIQLSSQTSGPAPPQLRDALLGVDLNMNRLIVFGGKSPGGSYSNKAFILDMNTLTWSTPTTTNPNLSAQPPGRASAVGGPDRAASYRSDFVVFGGQSENGPLNDLWMYNWNDQFWYEVKPTNGGPAPRWGAAGGTNPTAPQPATLDTALWVAGGTNGQENFALSDVWKLTILGVLAPNTQDINATWEKLAVPQQQASFVGQASTVVPDNNSGIKIAVVGGCAFGSSSTYNASCAGQNAFSLSVDSQGSSWTHAGACPAARFAPSLAPNLNSASTPFASQAFMLFGSIDEKRWSGDLRAADGEVAVLDVDQGTWTMVVPAGKNKPKPREGAAVVSHQNVKMGGTTFSDNTAQTIVFGGVDEDGNFLNDLWILRAYDGSVQPDSPTWQNVTVQYSTSCAKAIALPPSSPSSPDDSSTSTSAPSGPSQPSTPTNTSGVLFTTSTVHKALSPVSVALLLSAVAAYRSVAIPTRGIAAREQRMGLVYLSWIIGGIAYILGVIGFIVSFATSKRQGVASLARRATEKEPFLASGHAKAGFVIFIGLYALIPLVAIVSLCCCDSRRDMSDVSTMPEKPEGLQSDKSIDTISRALSPSPGPGALSGGDSSAHSANNSGTNSFRHLLGGRWKRQRVVSDSELSSPVTSDPPVRSFEVVRNHRRSGSGGRVPGATLNSHSRQNPSFSRMLSDINWMERRRSISAVGELDYAMSRMTPEPYPTIVEPPATAHSYHSAPSYPLPSIAVAHLALHAFLLAACVFSLVALFSRAPIAAFAIFLVWTVACYGAIFIAAWRGLPRESVLTVAIYRLRGRHDGPLPDRPGASPLQGHQHAPSSGSSRGPYTHHQPAYRLAPSHHDDEEFSRRGTTPFPRTSDSDDDDMDDDERQARLEHEMERRNVTIVSVPKPKLFVTNG